LCDAVRLFSRFGGSGGGSLSALGRSSGAVGSFDGAICSFGGLRDAIRSSIDLGIIGVT
jgi:hypothetical protein